MYPPSSSRRSVLLSVTLQRFRRKILRAFSLTSPQCPCRRARSKPPSLGCAWTRRSEKRRNRASFGRSTVPPPLPLLQPLLLLLFCRLPPEEAEAPLTVLRDGELSRLTLG